MNEKAVEYLTKAMNSYEEATVNKAVNILANIRLEAGDVDEQKAVFVTSKKSGNETYMLNYRWQTLNFKLR